MPAKHIHISHIQHVRETKKAKKTKKTRLQIKNGNQRWP